MVFLNTVANRSKIKITKVAHLKGHSGAIYHFSVDRENGLMLWKESRVPISKQVGILVSFSVVEA